MSDYRQGERSLRAHFESVADDVLLLHSFSGSEEVSHPYAFDLELLSPDPAIDADDLLRKWARLTVTTGDGELRYFHGIVSRFEQRGDDGRLTSYRATMVPWFWFLSLSQDCRVFQNLSVIQIIEEVFGNLGYSGYRFDCTNSYPQREYCVQYRESHLDFVSRLLEEEGIFYYFEHTDSKHELVLCDSSTSLPDCPGQASARMLPENLALEDGVLSLTHEQTVHIGKVTLGDYKYLEPSLKLLRTIPGQPGEEVYDYPGRFQSVDEGDRYARIRLEAQEVREKTVSGDSTCRAFTTGYSFALEDHVRSDLNQEYVLLRVDHWGRTGGYEAGDGDQDDYGNFFLAVPKDVPYRPLAKTPRPVVQGTQTATVVGKSGEEIWMDDSGRIKIQFHWDRIGARDENSSCWVRVATPWAGQGWGSVTIPRMGNEVVVDFLEGDPDRPIVVGSVYNGEQTPPHNGIQMGMKSRSSKGGGGYNEITLTDTKGEELITIHGQFDMATTIEHDRRVKIGNDESIDIGNDQTYTIGNNRTEEVGVDEKITIGSNRTESVGEDETISIGGNRSESVGSDESVSVGSDRSLSVGASQTITVGDSETVSVGKDRSTDIGKDESLNVGKNIVIEAGDSIAIKTGKASIVMKKDGTIVLQGKDIMVKGSGKVNVESSKDMGFKSGAKMNVKSAKDMVMKGKKILQN